MHAASCHRNGAAAGDDHGKTKRHPRWTREETLVLIQAKDLVENAGRKGLRFCSAFGSEDHVETKWEMISSYCRRHGVSRGPVQCRKRWSNLTGDFKKIKTWESQQQFNGGHGHDHPDDDHLQAEYLSFWTMRSDSRKEKRLPAYFDRHVYDVLDGKTVAAEPLSLAVMASTSGTSISTDHDRSDDDVYDEEDGGQEDHGEAALIGNDFKDDVKAEDHLLPDHLLDSRKRQQEGKQRGNGKARVLNTNRTQNTAETMSPPIFPGSGWSSTRWKRQRDDHLKEEIIKVLDANSKMLKAQFEIHNNNCRLDMEQRKEDSKSLVGALTKIAEAIGKIAEKL